MLKPSQVHRDHPSSMSTDVHDPTTTRGTTDVAHTIVDVPRASTRSELVAVVQRELMRMHKEGHSRHAHPLHHAGGGEAAEGSSASPQQLEHCPNNKRVDHHEAMRSLRLRRPVALDRAELYEAAQVYFSSPPVFYHCCYRRVVNMLAALQIFPMPSERTVLRLLSTTGYNEHTNRTAPMNFAQWQTLVDTIKTTFLRHQAEDNEDFVALRAAVLVSSGEAAASQKRQTEGESSEDDGAFGHDGDNPYSLTIAKQQHPRGDSLFAAPSKTVSPRQYTARSDDDYDMDVSRAGDIGSKSVVSDSWFQEAEGGHSNSLHTSRGVISRPIPDICSAVSAPLVQGAAQWLSLAAEVREPLHEDEHAVMEEPPLETSLNSRQFAHRKLNNQSIGNTAAVLSNFKGHVVTPMAASQLFLMTDDERKRLLEYFVLSLGAEDPDYRGDLTYTDLLKGTHHSTNDHFLGEDWWQALLLPEFALEDCQLLVVPEECRPNPPTSNAVAAAPTSALLPGRVVSFGEAIQLGDDNDIPEPLVPLAYLAYLRHRIVRGGGDEVKHSQQGDSLPPASHTEGLSSIHQRSHHDAGSRRESPTSTTHSPIYRSASAEGDRSYASLLFRNVSQLAVNAGRAADVMAVVTPPAAAERNLNNATQNTSTSPASQVVVEVLQGDGAEAFSPTIALEAGMSFAVAPTVDECPFGVQEESSTHLGIALASGDEQVTHHVLPKVQPRSDTSREYPTTSPSMSSAVKPQRAEGGGGGQFYPMRSGNNVPHHHGTTSPRSAISPTSASVPQHRPAGAMLMRVATPPSPPPAAVKVLPPLLDFDEFLQLITLHRILVDQHQRAGTRIPYMGTPGERRSSSSNAVARRSTSPLFDHVVRAAHGVESARVALTSGAHHSGKYHHGSGGGPLSSGAASPVGEGIGHQPSGRAFERTLTSDFSALSPRGGATPSTTPRGFPSSAADGPDWGGTHTARSLVGSQRHATGGLGGQYAHSVRRHQGSGGGNMMSSSMSSVSEAERMTERIDQLGPKPFTSAVAAGNGELPPWMTHMEKWLNDHDHEEDLRRIVEQLRLHQERRERQTAPFAHVHPRFETVMKSSCQRDEADVVSGQQAPPPLRIAQSEAMRNTMGPPPAPFVVGSVQQHLSTKAIKLAQTTPARQRNETVASAGRRRRQPTEPPRIAESATSCSGDATPLRESTNRAMIESTTAAPIAATNNEPSRPSAPPSLSAVPRPPQVSSYPSYLRVPKMPSTPLSTALDSVHARGNVLLPGAGKAIGARPLPSSAGRTGATIQRASLANSMMKPQSPPVTSSASPQQQHQRRVDRGLTSDNSFAVQHTPEFHRERMAAYRSVFQLS